MTSGIAENKRCRMYYGDVLSFDFTTVTNDLSGTIIITPKLKSANAKGYTYTKTSFSLKCAGVTNPSATDTAEMTIVQKANGESIATTVDAAAKS